VGDEVYGGNPKYTPTRTNVRNGHREDGGGGSGGGKDAA
jgi:hypothetical protein